MFPQKKKKKKKNKKKKKHKITIRSRNSTSGVYPKEWKVGTQDICTPIFITALFTVSKKSDNSNVPSVDKWINKRWYMHEVKNYLTFKRNEILIHVTT